MLLVEKSSGRVLNSNQAAQDAFGYSKQTLLKKNLWELDILKDPRQFKQVFLELEEKGFVQLLDKTIKTRQGGHFAADINLMDRAAVIHCNIRDISARKQAEEEIQQLNVTLEQRVEARTRELRAAQEQLVRKEKLATLGQMAGSVGRELRNPLGVINTSIYYLKMVQPEVNEKIKQHLDSARCMSQIRSSATC
jgi:two-component system sensor kinase FixL